MKTIKLTWYGRCCFVIETNDKKILIDPYDDFGHTDIGRIDADYLIISSIAHDHGNIAASPRAYVNGYRGRYKIKDSLYFNGIEAKEGRGTLTLLCNVENDPFYITNFADWGDPTCREEFTDFEKSLLKKTNIAFVRTREQEHHPENTCYELALSVCTPQIVIPIHHFPKSFYEKFNLQSQMHVCDEKIAKIDHLALKLPEYSKRVIDSYEVSLTELDLQQKTLLTFTKIHPQVKHIGM
jgi:hypothetical protein